MCNNRDARGAVHREHAHIFHEDQALRGIARHVPTDESVAAAKHEREAERPVQQAAHARVEHAFDQHVDGFAVSAHPRFEHGEARLHAEDQECAE